MEIRKFLKISPSKKKKKLFKCMEICTVVHLH